MFDFQHEEKLQIYGKINPLGGYDTILVTGGAGYIGSVLVRQLLARGHRVRVLDSLKFGGASLMGVTGNCRLEFRKGDIRDAADVKSAMQGISTVVHLAAIVGDPACKKFSAEAREVNTNGAGLVLQSALDRKVSRFFFSSTCSNYGIMKGDTDPLTEDTPLRPQSEYAEQKVGFEKHLLSVRKRNFHPLIFRFATVYGISPRMRFDLTVNHFSRDLALGRQLELNFPKAWRPYCHVEDLARAVVLAVGKDTAALPHRVYNTGSTKENYTKEMLADELRLHFPDARIANRKSGGEDPRDYRVDFTRISRELGFRITRRVPDGIREVKQLVSSGLLSDPFSSEYRNA